MEPNIGIVTGSQSGIIVIDVDGEQGLQSLEAMSAEAGISLRSTYYVSTGKGTHFYYLHDKNDITNSVGIMEQIDIRTDGGFIVAPPSQHVSGRRYQAENDLVNLQPIPEFLLSLLKRKKPVIKKAPRSSDLAENEPIPEGKRNDTLFHYGDSMRRKGASKQQILDTLFTINSERCVPPLGETEIRTISASVSSRVNYIMGKNGPKKCLHNLRQFIESRTDISQALAFNKMSNETVFTEVPFWREGAEEQNATGKKKWHPVEKNDLVHIVCMANEELQIDPSKGEVADVVDVVASRKPFHPVLSYLNALKWDGVERLRSGLTTYTGAEQTKWTQNVFRWWMISAVARVMNPGCKADHMLILCGPQGIRKSSFFATLAGEWFSDTALDLHQKDSFIALQGKWIFEFSELVSIKKSEVELLKGFLSSPVDLYRIPYHQNAKDFDRQCVFCGTTNSLKFLTDGTGNRRFWPVTFTQVDITGLQRDKDQLWAEAMELSKKGELWYPSTDEEHQLCASIQVQFVVQNPLEQTLELILKSRREVGMTELVEQLQRFNTSGDNHQGLRTKIGERLSRMGWERKESRRGGVKEVYYVQKTCMWNLSVRAYPTPDHIIRTLYFCGFI